jgi:hypothetical protein
MVYLTVVSRAYNWAD